MVKEERGAGPLITFVRSSIAEATAVQIQAQSLLTRAKLLFCSHSLMGKGFLTS